MALLEDTLSELKARRDELAHLAAEHARLEKAIRSIEGHRRRGNAGFHEDAQLGVGMSWIACAPKSWPSAPNAVISMRLDATDVPDGTRAHRLRDGSRCNWRRCATPIATRMTALDTMACVGPPW